jgi:hypothetical protein
MTVRQLIAALLDHPIDGEVAVCDRTSWDALERIMTDPSIGPNAALALAAIRMTGFTARRTNDLAEVLRVDDGDFKVLLVITGMEKGSY